MGSQPDYYSQLGLKRDATQEEIRRAYLKAVQRLHPDKNVNPGETELFLGVQQAYEVLADAKRRAQYDAILPPEPAQPELPVKINIQYSRSSLIRMGEPQLIYSLVEIEAEPRLAENSVPTLNICLVLDVSTSMNGEKLDAVKATALEIISKLRPQDVFSLVSFSDRANVLIPPTRNLDLKLARQKVQTLYASGGTEIFHGLKNGVEQVRLFTNPNSVNHVILLTDGQTYGDERDCLKLAEQAAGEKIGISGLGIGNGWNDIFLDSLTSLTGGYCGYIADPRSIQQVLLDKYEHLAHTFMEDVTLEISPGMGVDVLYAFRLQPEANPLALSNPIHLGPVQRTTSLITLIEFQVKPEAVKSANEAILFRGSLNFSMPAALYPIPSHDIKMSCPVTNDALTEPPPAKIIHALSRLTIYRMQEKARAEVGAGEYDKASRHLERMATNLLAQGERSLAKTVLLEAENIQRQKRFSENGEKDLKFSTRMLLMAGDKKQ